MLIFHFCCISNGLICIRWNFSGWLCELEDIGRYLPNIQCHFLYPSPRNSWSAPYIFLLSIFNGGCVLKINEKPQLHREQEHWLQYFSHFITIHLPFALSLDELWGQEGGGVGGACVLALIGGGSCGTVIFIISTSQNSISEAYLKVIVALPHLSPSKTLSHTATCTTGNSSGILMSAMNSKAHKLKSFNT